MAAVVSSPASLPGTPQRTDGRFFQGQHSHLPPGCCCRKFNLKSVRRDSKDPAAPELRHDHGDCPTLKPLIARPSDNSKASPSAIMETARDRKERRQVQQHERIQQWDQREQQQRTLVKQISAMSSKGQVEALLRQIRAVDMRLEMQGKAVDMFIQKAGQDRMKMEEQLQLLGARMEATAQGVEEIKVRVDHVAGELHSRVGDVQTGLTARVDKVEDHLATRVGGVEREAEGDGESLAARVEGIENGFEEVGNGLKEMKEMLAAVGEALEGMEKEQSERAAGKGRKRKACEVDGADAEKEKERMCEMGCEH